MEEYVVRRISRVRRQKWWLSSEYMSQLNANVISSLDRYALCECRMSFWTGSKSKSSPEAVYIPDLT